MYVRPCRQQDLFRVLKAYTLHRPEEGYCQAQAPIAAVLLMHMPAEVSTYFTDVFSSDKIFIPYLNIVIGMCEVEAWNPKDPV